MYEHLLSAFQLSGPDHGTPLKEADQIIAALQAPALAWLHMRADHPDTEGWIKEHLGFLNPVVISALLAQETRPRAARIGDGILLILRGVNTNLGQDPDDMVSIRVWVHDSRIVSLSKRPLAAVRHLQGELTEGNGPRTAGGFVCDLIEQLNVRIEDYLGTLDDETDALEEAAINEPPADLHSRVTENRQHVVSFRRHVAPQRDALEQLTQPDLTLFTPTQNLRLREAHNRLLRAIEELDNMRERLQLIKEELANLQSERLNRNLYVLSLVSAVFLPLGFMTGLMGINLSGMPGAAHPWAFWIFTGILALIVALQLYLLRRFRLF
jgi:zinc transporter